MARSVTTGSDRVPVLHGAVSCRLTHVHIIPVSASAALWAILEG